MNHTQRNVLAIGVALAVGLGVTYLMLKGSEGKVDQSFSTRFQGHIKAAGIEPVSAYLAEGAISVYCLTPPIEGGVPYVIEVYYVPGVVGCWARSHDNPKTPVEAFHPNEVASSEYKVETGEVTRNHRNCTEPVFKKLFEYFDKIRDAAETTARGE
jgi:hypothetical protein